MGLCSLLIISVSAFFVWFNVAIAGLKQGQAKLEDGQAKLDGRLTKLEDGQAKLESRMGTFESKLDKLLAAQGIK